MIGSHNFKELTVDTIDSKKLEKTEQHDIKICRVIINQGKEMDATISDKQQSGYSECHAA